jgi:hypothetical protein
MCFSRDDDTSLRLEQYATPSRDRKGAVFEVFHDVSPATARAFTATNWDQWIATTIWSATVCCSPIRKRRTPSAWRIVAHRHPPAA